MDYTLRDFEDDFWHSVKVKAVKSKKTIRFVILSLLSKWLKGEVEL
jgi:hypothetical protein